MMAMYLLYNSDNQKNQSDSVNGEDVDIDECISTIKAGIIISDHLAWVYCAHFIVSHDSARFVTQNDENWPRNTFHKFWG